LAEAEQIQRENLENTRRAEGADNPDTTMSMSDLGITLGQERKVDESEKILREALAIEAKARGEDNPEWRVIMGNLGATLAYRKKADEVRAVFEKLIANASKAEGTDQATAHLQYGAALAVLGRKDDAIEHLQTAAKLGFEDPAQLETSDLKQLRSDPRFQAVVDQIRKNHEAGSR